jgi:hypothetical protein
MERVDVVEMASSLAISKSKVDRERKEDFDDLQLEAEIECVRLFPAADTREKFNLGQNRNLGFPNETK